MPTFRLEEVGPPVERLEEVGAKFLLVGLF